MGLMRALKNVGIGYLQGSTDIMAQRAKEKREDEKIASEQEFELQKQKDYFYNQKLVKLAVLNEKIQKEQEIKTQEEKEFIDNKKEQLGQEGWNTPFLDIVELQGHLNSDAAWNVWFNRYDTFMQNNKYGLDWNVNAQIPTQDGTIGFQDAYIEHYYKTVGNKDNDFNMASVLSQNLNMSDNVSKSQTDGVNDNPGSTDTDTTNTIYNTTKNQIPGPIEGVIDTTQAIEKDNVEAGTTGAEDFKPLKGNTSFLAIFEKPRYAKELWISSPSDENWAYTNMPKSALEEGKMIKLTLAADGSGYTSSIVDVAETFDDLQERISGRDKEIVDQIYKNKGLFNESEDMINFMKDGLSAQEYFAQNAQKQKLFVKVYEYATILDASNYGYIAKGPQMIVQDAIKLSNVASADNAERYVVAMNNIDENKEGGSIEKANIALMGVNEVMSQVKEATASIPKDTKEGQALISRIQAKALNEFKINFGFTFLDNDERISPTATNNPKYKDAIKLIDNIVRDKQQGANGNKGAFWITKADLEKGFEKIREDTKFQAPFIGIDKSIPVPGGDGDGDGDGDRDGGDSGDVVIPSSVKDGITTYDLSGLPKDEDAIQQIKNVDFAKTQKYNLDNKATEQTGYTYILKDGSQINVMPGDIINIRGRNKIVNLSTMGDEGNKQLLIQPYSGSVKENPNRVLLDSKIKQLNKIEKLSMPSGTTTNPMNEQGKKDWIKRKEERIATLKKEIEELYIKIKG